MLKLNARLQLNDSHFLIVLKAFEVPSATASGRPSLLPVAIKLVK
jgi:hypothetical protein